MTMLARGELDNETAVHLPRAVGPPISPDRAAAERPLVDDGNHVGCIVNARRIHAQALPGSGAGHGLLDKPGVALRPGEGRDGLDLTGVVVQRDTDLTGQRPRS